MIRVDHLSFTYRTAARRTLEEINFHVDRGEIFGFLGPSGAGKSTLQKILVGFETDYTGHASVNGIQVRNRNHDYYDLIGVQFETPGFYGRFTALENLKLFSSLHNRATEDPEELMHRVGLGGDIGRKVSEYSKGMRIRLDLVRSLLHSPEVLFLDEPTAGLDPFHIELVLDEIRKRKNGGTTVLIATHDMDVASRLCDRLAFLSGGKIQALDTPRDLMVGRSGGSFRLEFRRGDRIEKRIFSLDRPGQDSEFLEICRNEKLETIHSLEPSLGEVFVEITGRGLV